MEGLLLRAPAADLEPLRGLVAAAEELLESQGATNALLLSADASRLGPQVQQLPEAEGAMSASARGLGSSIMRGAGRGLHMLEAAFARATSSSSSAERPSVSSPPAASSPMGARDTAELAADLHRALDRHHATCLPALAQLQQSIAHAAKTCSDCQQSLLRACHQQLCGLSALQTLIRSVQERGRALEALLQQWEEDLARITALDRLPAVGHAPLDGLPLPDRSFVPTKIAGWKR